MAGVVNVSRLMKKLDKLGGDSSNAFEKGIEHGGKLVLREAKALVSPIMQTGDLHNSLKLRVENKGTKAKGVVYTNLEYAPYVEFGTGPIGEEMGGIAPELKAKIKYKEDGWYIPGDEIEDEVAELYHFRKVTIGGQVFYYSEGQPAQPYMYPALHDNKHKVKESISRQLRKEIKKICNGGG